MISRLLDLAKHLREARRHCKELGLSTEETAFYDALAENGSAKEIMKKRHPTADDPRANRDGEEDAEARLDPTRVGASGTPAKRSSPIGKIRLPA